jgi:translation initiation factor 3 subunit F
VDLLTTEPTPSPSLPPLPTLSSSLSQLDDLLSQTLTYVQSVTSGQTAGNPEVGRYLLENVGRWSSGAGDDGEGVKDGLQDTLTVSYLASLVRSQVELSGRLGLVQVQQQQQV